MDSDPDLEIIEKDSGMSSLGGSKDETPERKAVIVCFPLQANKIDDNQFNHFVCSIV